MPVMPHDCFPSPPPERPLWRYLNFTKFISILTTRTLWFARADQLGDPFECSIPNWLPALAFEPATSILYRMNSEYIAFEEQMHQRARLWLFISCWYGAQTDSAAMWSAYGTRQDGVAIRTSVDRFSQALNADARHVTLAAVQYSDYSIAEAPPGVSPHWRTNMLTPAFSKRLSYEHEKEVRAIFMHHEDPDHDQPIGFQVDIDLEALVTEVTVAPFAEEWFVSLVAACTKNAGLSVPISRSDIGGTPNWRSSIPPSFSHLPEFPLRAGRVRPDNGHTEGTDG